MSMPGLVRRILRRLRNEMTRLFGPKVHSVQSVSSKEFLKRFEFQHGDEDFDPVSEFALDELLQRLGRRVATGWPDIPKVITDLRIDLSRMTDDEIIHRADAALDGDLHPSGVRPQLTASGDIDWSSNPSDSREWLLMLHRHAWWPLWGAAYRLTGDEKYAQAFVAQLMNWVDRNPMPKQKAEFRESWRLMEAGLRMRISWIPVFGCFFSSAAFTDDVKLEMLRAIYDHAQFLNKFFTNRNHLVRESNGLIAVGLCFPEMKMAEKWVTRGLHRLDEELRQQVNQDGSHIEMSVGYQWLTIDEFEATRSLLDEYGRRLPVSDLHRALHYMYAFLAAVIRPDRTFPQLNDGFILWDAERLADAGYEPDSESRSFPNAGVHVMRSGSSPDARYLVADTGPYGGPHGHEDKLSFELFAYGAPFIVDPGSYTYQKSDPYREYFVGSQGHNSVLVDQGSQVRRWQSKHMTPAVNDETHGTWQSTDQIDFVSGRYDEGYAPFSLLQPADVRIDRDVAHQRDFLFAKPDYWVVADYLDANNEHDYTFLFHLAPDVVVEKLTNSTALLRSRRNGAQLALAAHCDHEFSSELFEGSESPIQGWYSEDHYKKCTAPALSFCVSRLRSAFVTWVLCPLEPGADAGQIQTTASFEKDPEQLVLSVHRGDQVDYVKFFNDESRRTAAGKRGKSSVSVERQGSSWSFGADDS